MKIKLIHDTELVRNWFGSKINYSVTQDCALKGWSQRESICTSSLLDMSHFHQFDNYALKSTLIKYYHHILLIGYFFYYIPHDY